MNLKKHPRLKFVLGKLPLDILAKFYETTIEEIKDVWYKDNPGKDYKPLYSDEEINQAVDFMRAEGLRAATSKLWIKGTTLKVLYSVYGIKSPRMLKRELQIEDLPEEEQERIKKVLTENTVVDAVSTLGISYGKLCKFKRENALGSRARYSDDLKVKVIKYAAEHGLKEASKHFNLEYKRVYYFYKGLSHEFYEKYDLLEAIESIREKASSHDFYPPALRIKVIKYAAEHGLKEASKYFNLEYKTVYYFCKKLKPSFYESHDLTEDIKSVDRLLVPNSVKSKKIEKESTPEVFQLIEKIIQYSKETEVNILMKNGKIKQITWDM